MVNAIQVRFKSNRKEFFDNKHRLHVKPGDWVVVQAETGVDLGLVTLTDIPEEIVAGRELRAFVRLANPDEVAHVNDNRCDETRAQEVFKRKVQKFGLRMKLVEAEYQFDRRRIVFYFTAEKRVDFRVLVRDLASEFKTRIELRQIGVRDEAKRVGGYGPCGKCVCCGSHLQNFQPITTDFAKVQGLQLNPSKLTGLCGRLKCCLAYEKDFYVNTLSRFPGVGSPLMTTRGPGEIRHMDIIGNAVLIKHAEEWETLSLEDVAQQLGIDLPAPSGCNTTGSEVSCEPEGCDRHDRIQVGEIENPLKEFMRHDAFFDDHCFPRPTIY